MKIKNIGSYSFLWLRYGKCIEIKPGDVIEVAPAEAKTLSGLFASEIIEDEPVITGATETIKKVEKNGKKRKSNKSNKK